MKTETARPPTPAEVLIPEARRHQRRRRQRTGGFLVVVALVIAAVVVSALLLWRGPAAGDKAQPDPKPAAVTGTSGVVYFRPVLCFAAAFAAPSGTTPNAVSKGTGPIPACSAASQLTGANMDTSPASDSPTGFTFRNVPPDPQYAAYPSSSVHEPRYAWSTVLLPGLNGACDGAKVMRCVLGPAEMSSRSVRSAKVMQTRTGQWIVSYTTTGAGSALWDKVASENFHQYLGIEVGGVVYSAPLMQPTQSSFSSFDGRGEISGSLNRSEATSLAKALTSHRG
jgi:hypothetical protein